MKIGVFSCTGKYGQEICEIIINTPNMTLGGVTARQNNSFLGKDIGTLLKRDMCQNIITDDLLQACQESDVMIDFSHPDALDQHLASVIESKTAYVLGTTGFTPHQQDALHEAAKDIPILQAPNMSLGVTFLSAISEMLAQKLDFDIEILDFHHRRKSDSPSGTALDIGKKIANARHQKFEDVAQFDRSQHHRKDGEIGFASLRGGSVIADCSIIFAGDGERLELTHRADNSQIFSHGAVKAAQWITNQKPGLYSMKDIFFKK